MRQSVLSRIMAKSVVLLLLILTDIYGHESEANPLNVQVSLVLSENNSFADCQKYIKLLDRTASGRVKRSWVEEMLDSWTVFRSDIKYGNTIDFGNFDKCMAIHNKFDDGGSVDGQYCLVQFYSTGAQVNGLSPKLSMFNENWKDMKNRLGGAICIPSSCPPEVVKPLMDELFVGTKYEMATDYDQAKSCKRSSEPFRKTGSMKALAWIITTLLLLAIFSTVYDLTTKNTSGSGQNQLMLTFSLCTNARNLFSMDQEKSADAIGCLHGIRVASTLTIILFHTYFHRVMYPLKQTEETAEFMKSSSERLTISLMTTVESFFVLSGFLATRSLFKDLDTGRFNIFKLYLQRFLRLTPALAFIVLVSICCGEYFSQTAPYAFKEDLVDPCQRHWLATILHIQVYTNPTDLCMLTTWYLSVEWQMFLLAPILVYPIWKYCRRSFLFILTAIIMASIYHQYLLSISIDNLVKDLELATHPNDKLFQTFYLPTHVRGSSFLVGMFLGYVLHYRNDKSNMSSLLKYFLWVVAIVTIVGNTTFFIVGYWNEQTSLEYNAIFTATYRYSWSLPIAWSIFAFVSGSGKSFNDFLSHRFWIPIGKLGLCLYLIHPVLQYAILSSQRSPIQFGEPEMKFNYLTDVLGSLAFAIPLHLLVEAPFNHLSKLLLKKL